MTSREILAQYATEQGWTITSWSGANHHLRMKVTAGGQAYVMDLFFTPFDSVRTAMIGKNVEWSDTRVNGGRPVLLNVIMKLAAGVNYDQVLQEARR